MTDERDSGVAQIAPTSTAAGIMRNGARGVAQLAAIATALAALAPSAAQATYPGRNGPIAVAGFDFGSRNIGLVAPSGGHVRKLIRNASQPAWSPRGRRLAFTRLLAVDELGFESTAVFVSAPDGRPRRVTPHSYDYDSPAWSPDGRRLAVEKAGADETTLRVPEGVYTVSSGGGHARPLIAFNRYVYHEADSPTWSLYGQLAFVEGFGLYVKNPGRRARQILHMHGIGNPDWSPSGDRIAFDTGYPHPSVYTVGRGGSGLHRVTAGFDPSWAPDGSRIAFSDSGVWTVHPDGSGRDRLTRQSWEQPAWQPLVP